jgi:hypothetical protein
LWEKGRLSVSLCRETLSGLPHRHEPKQKPDSEAETGFSFSNKNNYAAAAR